MSLGPPFDASGERVQFSVGAVTVILVLAAVAIALLASDRTLGESMTLRVRLATPGTLRTGAPLRLAGRQVGEVVAIRSLAWLAPGRALGERPGVELEVRLLKAYQPYVHRNAEFFAHSDNVLTGPTLEIGPPRHGAAPDRPVEDGETVRGTDPPEIDRLLEKVHESLTVILGAGRDLDSDWANFRGAFSQLLGTVEQMVEPGLMTRMLFHGGRALHALAHLMSALREAQAPERLQRLARELDRALAELQPDLRLLGQRLGQIDGQLQGLTSALGPQQRRQLEASVAQFRQAIAMAERLGADLRWMVAQLEEGRGTVGGFQQDIQIFDELKEIHRILKQRLWRVFIKRPNTGQRHLR